MKKFLVLSTITLGLVLNLAASDYQKELEKVNSGKCKEARAEWWGCPPEDSTKNLQAALNSGVKKLIISKQPSPWIINKTLELPNNIEILFEDGAEIIAKKGCFKKNVDCLIKARDRKNITLCGKGKITMNKKDYEDKSKYKGSSHRHTLGLYNCQNITIKGLTIQKSGGDGIYANNVKNILIDNVILDNHRRQGISVISAENLLISNSTIKNTKGAAPQSGIDFEPNEKDEQLINCHVENCLFENNQFSAININLTHLDSSQSPPVDITIENCLFKGGELGLSFMQMQKKGTESTAKGKITFKNCKIDSPKVRAIKLDSLRSTGPSILFNKLSITQGAGTGTPIYFFLRHFLHENSGNLYFRNCSINIPGNRDILDCWNFSSGALENVTGKVIFNGKSVDLAEFIQKKEYNIKPPAQTLQETKGSHYQPANFSDTETHEPMQLVQRGATDFILYAPKNKEVTFALEYKRMGSYPTPPLALTLTSPDEQTQTLEKLEYQKAKPQQFRFIPQKTGGYILSIPKHINCIIMKECSVPWGVFSRKKIALYNLFKPNGTIYFAIPPKVTSFIVEVNGNGGASTVDANIICDNKTVASAKKISRSKYFNIKLAPSHKPRLGKLVLSNAKSGVSIMFPEPLSPIFSNSAKNVFIKSSK